MAALPLQTDKPAKTSNLCTVFDEPEVIALLAGGAPLKDLVAGIHGALASRIADMGEKTQSERGRFPRRGAKNKGLDKALCDALGCAVSVPAEPLLTGGVGVALIGSDIAKKSKKDELAMERKERVLQAVEVF